MATALPRTVRGPRQWRFSLSPGRLVGRDQATGSASIRCVLRCRLTTKIFPTYASWLNRVDRCVALLTDKKLRRGTYRSIQALDKDIREWISAWNENPILFTWTKNSKFGLSGPLLRLARNFVGRFDQQRHSMVRGHLYAEAVQIVDGGKGLAAEHV